MATKKTTSSTSKTKTSSRNKTTTKSSSTKTTNTTKTKTTKTQTKTKPSSTTIKSSSNRVKKPAGTTTPKTKTTSNTRRKTTNTPANNISFTNTRISKGLTYTASYNGGNNVDFSMTLHDNEGKLVTGSMPIARIREILKPNYNIGIIGFTCGIYTFEFDRREFEQFLANNGI